MIKILYGTTNKGKMQAMRTALESFDLDVKDVSTSVDDGVRKFFKQIFAG